MTLPKPDDMSLNGSPGCQATVLMDNECASSYDVTLGCVATRISYTLIFLSLPHVANTFGSLQRTCCGRKGVRSMFHASGHEPLPRQCAQCNVALFVFRSRPTRAKRLRRSIVKLNIGRLSYEFFRKYLARGQDPVVKCID